ncbi:hypothetical protein AVEN_240359-1 [Araneus ventricosus]|uniref:Histone-lysine N-methyltransferase SETMAR n=1 Tax=Araneus ventricosus TaxID=182803 RepID=A0A4Y2F2I9_ARAVE|nr:hypothetical protein AVEN_240359-1 [Araneus ventricosus]
MLPPSASCVVLAAFFKHKVGLWKTLNAAISYQSSLKLRRAILTFGVVLIHDNAHPHSAVVTQELLEQFKWDVSDRRHITPTYQRVILISSLN